MLGLTDTAGTGHEIADDLSIPADRARLFAAALRTQYFEVMGRAQN